MQLFPPGRFVGNLLYFCCFFIQKIINSGTAAFPPEGIFEFFYEKVVRFDIGFRIYAKFAAVCAKNLGKWAIVRQAVAETRWQ